MTFEGTQALINSLVAAGLLVPRFMGDGVTWYSVGNRVLSTNDVRVGWIERMRTALADAEQERDEWKAKYEDLIERDRRHLPEAES